MARPRGVLIQTLTGWTLLFQANGNLATAELDSPSNVESASDLLLGWLMERWPHGAELTIGFRAESCLVVPVDPEAIDSRRTSLQELIYEVEENLPWSAEDVVVTNVGACAIALPVTLWQEVLDPLREEGFKIPRLLPVGWMWEQGLRERWGLDKETNLLFQNDEGIHFFSRQDEQLIAWRYWPNDRDEEIFPSLRLIIGELKTLLDSQQRLLAINLPEQLVQSLEDQDLCIETASNELIVEECLWEGVDACRKQSPTFNLAVGPLAGAAPLDALVQAIQLCCWSLILFCLVSVGVLVVKSQHLQGQTKEMARQQAELFQDTFPGMSVPQAIFARFESEHRKVMGQRGTNTSQEFPDVCLNILRQILEAHAQPLRSRFEEIVIRNGQVEIECEFRNHEEAARMVSSLEKAGLTILPPQFQKIDDQRVGARLRTPAKKGGTP